LGQRVWHVSEKLIFATPVKIGMNYAIIHALHAFGESVTLVERGDLVPAGFVEILNAAPFPGPVYDGCDHMIAERRYAPPSFSMRLGRKDLHLAQQAAQTHGVELATSPALATPWEMALSDRAVRPRARRTRLVRRQGGHP
jgi:3-hydroxyisobutyrate dehydrogenase-like beta-hydroxyacid dehydrogenase